MIGREGWEKQGKTYDAEIGDKQMYPLGNNLRAEMGARVKQHKKKPTSHCLFQSIGSTLRNRVPKFRRPEMDIIDTEQIHIFDMPGKSCPPHPKIKIRGVDAWQALIR
jgi:hypothetical protein